MELSKIDYHNTQTSSLYCVVYLYFFLCSGGFSAPPCVQVDPLDFFSPHSIQTILLHLHLYWKQNPSRFLLKCAVHDWDLWSLLVQR